MGKWNTANGKLKIINELVVSCVNNNSFELYTIIIIHNCLNIMFFCVYRLNNFNYSNYKLEFCSSLC